MSLEFIRRRYQHMLRDHLSSLTGEEPKDEDIDKECEQLVEIYKQIREGKFKGKIQRIIGKMQSHLMKSRKQSQVPPKVKLNMGQDLWKLIQELPLSFGKNDCVCYQPPSEWINPLGMRVYCRGQPWQRTQQGFCRKECPYTTDCIRVLLKALLSWKEAKTKSGFSLYKIMEGLGEPQVS